MIKKYRSLKKFTGHIPLVSYLLWVTRKHKIKKGNPTLYMGHMAEAFGCQFGQKVALFDRCSLLNSSLGCHVRIGIESNISHCHIGPYSGIGPQCLFGLGIHPLNYVSSQNCFYQKNNLFPVYPPGFHLEMEEMKTTHIGSDVWIGSRVIIPGGITIGHGSVIAAGSIVTKDMPPYSIAAGAPAKVIRYRFTPDIIDSLLKIQWWNWPEKTIKERHSQFFDIKQFIQQYSL